jgi:hypothetical protein
LSITSCTSLYSLYSLYFTTSSLSPPALFRNAVELAAPEHQRSAILDLFGQDDTAARAIRNKSVTHPA